jgi:hypothetical protein
MKVEAKMCEISWQEFYYCRERRRFELVKAIIMEILFCHVNVNDLILWTCESLKMVNA